MSQKITPPQPQPTSEFTREWIRNAKKPITPPVKWYLKEHFLIDVAVMLSILGGVIFIVWLII